MRNLTKMDFVVLRRKSTISALFFIFLVSFTFSCSGMNAMPQDTCSDSATEVDLLKCRKLDKSESEKVMKKLYTELYGGYLENEPNLAPLFKQSMESWEVYKVAGCKVQTYYSIGGSAFEVYWLDCLTSMNRGKIVELQNFISAP